MQKNVESFVVSSSECLTGHEVSEIDIYLLREWILYMLYHRMNSMILGDSLLFGKWLTFIM